MSNLAGKSLLFVGGGEECVPGILRARELGIKTAVLDRLASAPGAILADRILTGSIFDVERAVSLAKDLNSSWPINGVTSVATDAPMTVAAVAASLWLPGIGRTSADLVSNKLSMKETLVQAGIPTAPGFRVFSAAHLRAAIEDLGGVAVVKPVDSRGARGVSFVTPEDDCEARFGEALKESPTGAVVVERFLDGPQFSTESVVHGGRIRTVGVSTRNYERLPQTYPFPVEDGGDLPAQLSPVVAKEIDDVLLAAASALGISSWTVKGDLVVHEGKVFIIELAGRLSGGYLATHMIPLSTGIDYLAAAFRLAFGLEPDWEALNPSSNVPVAQRYFFPRAERIESIIIPDWLSAHPDVSLFVMRAQVGDTVAKIRNHPARAGLVITTGRSRGKAIELAERVIQEVEIRTVAE